MRLVFLENTFAAINGRTILHVSYGKGAGGGHALRDIIRAAGESYVIPSSTNPTRPYARNTVEEHLDMLMVVSSFGSGDSRRMLLFAFRFAFETIAAEDILHDLGVFSIISSDSQAMGRVGEVIIRTWQTADKMKKQRGKLELKPDSFRQRLHQKICRQIYDQSCHRSWPSVISSVEVGKLADLDRQESSLFWGQARNGDQRRYDHFRSDG